MKQGADRGASFRSFINSMMSWWKLREMLFQPYGFAPVFDVAGPAMPTVVPAICRAPARPQAFDGRVAA